ncbi:dienelactone hydrolase family protein [Elstera litoralis]|uniref:dienelactone hydrolase family protein n=1 Tax=Elstera litoralis TaxID=552518 RepID=UPI0009FEB2AE|nr:dienelactone hydrolase family protein [Elstera litoralis]
MPDDRSNRARLGRARRRCSGNPSYLAQRPDVQADKIALLGWSNGGSTVLSVIGRKTALKGGVAFYPGCQFYADQPRWHPRVPLAIEMGAADNWTDPQPCETIAARWPDAITLTLYSGAYHDFDWPNLPLTLRTGLASSKDKTGQAYVGTNPAARDKAVAQTLAQFRRWFGQE